MNDKSGYWRTNPNDTTEDNISTRSTYKLFGITCILIGGVLVFILTLPVVNKGGSETEQMQNTSFNSKKTDTNGFESNYDSISNDSNNKQFEQAQGSYNQVMNSSLSGIAGYKKLADYYKSEKMPSEAIIYYNKMINIETTNPMLFFERGLLLLQCASLLKLSEIISDSSRLEPFADKAFRLDDELTPSLTDFTMAIKYDPSNIAFWLQRGNTYYAIGEWSRHFNQGYNPFFKNALADYEEALKIDPTNKDAIELKRKIMARIKIV